jgi:hypothetical protein
MMFRKARAHTHARAGERAHLLFVYFSDQLPYTQCKCTLVVLVSLFYLYA